MRESPWLREIRRLDPERDCRRIVFLNSFCEFPFDTTRALELAFFKTFASPMIAERRAGAWRGLSGTSSSPGSRSCQSALAAARSPPCSRSSARRPPIPCRNHGRVGDMDALVEMRCVACRRDAPTVSDAEVEELRPQIPDWELIEVDGVNRLRRVFRFQDFADALRFTNAIGALAEEEGHHPALLTEWGRTTITWWTHKIRGLHRNDFIMAAKTDAAYRASTEAAA
jgi:4a-hydroxytetrahydrobiopterin dehydratase